MATGCVPDERPGDHTRSAPAPAAVPRPTPAITRSPFPGLPTSLPSAANPARDPELDPPLERDFADRFDRAALGPDWVATSPGWRLEGGRVCVQNAHNHPLWLKRRLPVNARIEFDATTSSSDGDIKAEFWGDGMSAAQTISYNAATSYLTIFGGWHNQFQVLARIDEHAKDRPEVRITNDPDDLRARRVEPNRSYHFKVVRDDGRTVHWYVDDLEILSYPDPQPLSGAGHDHFGFNDWEVRLCFDNLTVARLP
jgi:hypothetical protein